MIIKNPSPSVTLLEWMRETRGLTAPILDAARAVVEFALWF